MSFNYQAAVNISAEFTGQRGIDQAKKSMKDLTDQTSGLKGEFNNLIKGGLDKLIAAFAVKEIVEYGKGIIELGDHLNDLRQKTGIGVQALSALKTAAELGGSSFEGLENGLRKFSSNIGLAGAGVQGSKAAFDVLGITLKNSNGGIKDTSELLFEVSDKFEKMKDGPEKAAIAIKLFGKTGTDLIPVLNDGSESLKKFGLNISDDFARRADQFNDSLVLMKKNSTDTGIAIVSGALPALNDLTDVILQFQNENKESGQSFSILGETIRQLGLAGVVTFQTLGLAFDVLSVPIVEVVSLVKLLGQEFYDLGYAGDAAIKLLTGDLDGAKKSISTYAAEAKKDASGFADASLGLGEDFYKKTEARAQKTIDIINKIQGQSQIFGSGPKAIDTSKKKSTFAPDLSDFNTGEESQKEKEIKSIAKFIIEKNKELELQQTEIDKVNLTESAYKKLNIQTTLKAQSDKEGAGFTQENKDLLNDVTKAIIKQKQALVDQEEAQKHSFGQGAKEAFKDYLTAAADTAAQTKALFGHMFTGLEDAFVDFVKTGKINFSNLISSLESDLLRLGFRKAVLAGLGGAFGGDFSGVGSFANGGIMTSKGSLPLNKYANGGVANSPQMAIFGEGRMPEAYVPLPDGRSIPVKNLGGSSGGNTTISVEVNVSSRGSESDAKSNTNQGKQLGNLIAISVQNEIIKQKRSGGMLR